MEKRLESPLDFMAIQPAHPKGNQSWVFIGRTDAEAETPILWQVRRAVIKRQPLTNIDEGVEEKEPSCPGDGNVRT